MSPRLPQNAADRARRAPERAPQSAGVWPIRQSRQNDIASRFQRESRPPTKSRPTRFTCSRTGPKLLQDRTNTSAVVSAAVGSHLIDKSSGKLLGAKK